MPNELVGLWTAPSAWSVRSPCGVACRWTSAGSATATSPLQEPQSVPPSPRPGQVSRTNFPGRSIRLAIRSIFVLSLNSGHLSGLGFRGRASEVPVGRVGLSRPIAPISKSYVVWLSYGKWGRSPNPGRNCPHTLGSWSFARGRPRDAPRASNQGMLHRLRDSSFEPGTLFAANPTRDRGGHRPHGPDQTFRLAANHVERTAITAYE